MGDALSYGGGCTSDIINRCKVASGKFRQLLPVLKSRNLPLLVRGRVYNSCVRPIILYGGKTWPPNDSDLQLLHRNLADIAMLRWICGIKAKNGILSEVLLANLHLVEATVELRAHRLR